MFTEFISYIINKLAFETFECLSDPGTGLELPGPDPHDPDIQDSDPNDLDLPGTDPHDPDILDSDPRHLHQPDADLHDLDLLDTDLHDLDLSSITQHHL